MRCVEFAAAPPPSLRHTACALQALIGLLSEGLMRILSNVRLVLAAAIAALPSPSLVHAATPPVDRTWSNEFATPAFDHDVNCAVRWRGGLVVGGWFTLAGIVPAWNIAWWDGSRWRDLGGGVDGPVRCLAVVDDTLLVGGDF